MNDENRTPRDDDDRPTDRQPPVPADETPTAHTPTPHVRDGVHGGGTVAAASDAGDPPRRRRFAALRRRSALPAVAAGATPSGDVILDPAGAQELSDYLVGRGSRVRFFAQTVVDLDPGDPFPEGEIRTSVNVTVRAVGSLI